MTTGSLQQILHPIITTKVISRIAVAENPLLRLFGFEPGGPCEMKIGHRQHGYDTFNNVRTAAQAAAPGRPAATVTRNPVGRVNVTIARAHEKLPLLAEELHNYRPIGGSSAVFDNMGATFIRRQQRFMGQRIGNFRAAMLAGMIQGKMYLHKSGDNMYYNFTSSGALLTIDFQRPNSTSTGENYNQLNMVGTSNTDPSTGLAGAPIIQSSWANPSTDITKHIAQIDVTLQQTVGTNLGRIICGEDIWQAVTENDYVIAKAGIANAPFSEYIRDESDELDNPKNLKKCRLRAFPWLEWIVTDSVLQLGALGSETYVKFVPAGSFWFGPKAPNPLFWEIALGSEPVSEGPNMPWVDKMGMTSWTTYTYDPTGVYLYTLDNAIPCEYIPAASGLATAFFTGTAA
jgi:hypothetical protein